MENNKGQTIFLSVIGIATLLVAIVGATFAWFSTTISGDGASANITTASISALQLNGTQVSGTNVLPGWESADASFTISGTVTGSVSVPYTCEIKLCKDKDTGKTIKTPEVRRFESTFICGVSGSRKNYNDV